MSGQATGWVLRHGPRPEMIGGDFKRYGERARGMRAVLLVIADKADQNGEHAHPGNPKISERALYGPRQTANYVRLLISDGWLQIEERGGGRGKATVYRIPGVSERAETSHSGVQRNDRETVHSGVHRSNRETVHSGRETLHSAGQTLQSQGSDLRRREHNVLLQRPTNNAEPSSLYDERTQRWERTRNGEMCALCNDDQWVSVPGGVRPCRYCAPGLAEIVG